MFITALDEYCGAQNLYHRLSMLTEINPEQWNETYQDEYNKCDEQHIIGMLAAEKKTCKVKTTAWSPTYSKAVESKAFWKIALSLKKKTQNHIKNLSIGQSQETSMTSEKSASKKYNNSCAKPKRSCGKSNRRQYYSEKTI
jgi:hypothetical protein